jgi:DNA-binding CsgD family transcriptional regulator
MKGLSQAEKVLQLNIAGFSNIQIAEFLQTTPAVVATLLYQSKKGSKPRSRK